MCLRIACLRAASSRADDAHALRLRLHARQDTAEKYREELEKLPRDEEVDAADRKKSEAARIFGAATAWSHPERPTPWWMRANLVIGTSLQIFACYAAQFFGR